MAFSVALVQSQPVFVTNRVLRTVIPNCGKSARKDECKVTVMEYEPQDSYRWARGSGAQVTIFYPE